MASASATATATDPICLMTVDTANPNGGRSEHAGQTYYFCAPGCRIAFERDPEGWASGRNRPIAMDAGESESAPAQPQSQAQPLTLVRRLLRRKSE